MFGYAEPGAAGSGAGGGGGGASDEGGGWGAYDGMSADGKTPVSGGVTFHEDPAEGVPPDSSSSSRRASSPAGPWDGGGVGS
jgi:hypothetical protein